MGGTASPLPLDADAGGDPVAQDPPIESGRRVLRCWVEDLPDPAVLRVDERAPYAEYDLVQFLLQALRDLGISPRAC